MSCNGCRVLRKGCSENCILRPCLQWIESPQAQAHATVFVAKFFGRAGLMSFISSVPDKQRPALFQSLLFEACGRTVNPVNGAVGLLWTGNWHVCQAAVQTVLRGGALCPFPEFLSGATLDLNDTSEAEINRISDTYEDSNCDNRDSNPKRRRSDVLASKDRLSNLGLSLTPCSTSSPKKQWRCGTPSMNSEEESGTTTCSESGDGDQEPKLLKLFT